MLATPTTPAIHYQRVGVAGPKVLLLMGFGMRGEVWKPQIEGLATSCEVIYFDNRGIGDSDAANEAMSMKDMAQDAERVLDAAGWDTDIHVVGISMGGMMAQELALIAPERVASLTLLATHAGGRSTWLPPAKGILRFLAVQASPKHKRAQALAKLLYPKNFLRECDSKALHQRMRFQLGPRAKRATLRRQLAAIRSHDTRSRLHQLQMPTLIVRPALDILISPHHSDVLQRGIRHASLLDLPKAGHGLIFQCADQLNRRLLEHFEAATPA